MITVLAGVNGAGKSSLLGSSLRSEGFEYFNPDEIAKQLMAEKTSLSLEKANGLAWIRGKKMLKLAIEKNDDYIFESTLGGNTITRILMEAALNGTSITIIYCGLESVDLHIKRVADRVAKGGHDIPKAKVKQRWLGSIENMMKLITVCESISVFDNTVPLKNGKPCPKKLFAFSENRWLSLPVENMPQWARPLATTAIKMLSEK